MYCQLLLADVPFVDAILQAFKVCSKFLSNFKSMPNIIVCFLALKTSASIQT